MSVAEQNPTSCVAPCWRVNIASEPPEEDVSDPLFAAVPVTVNDDVTV